MSGPTGLRHWLATADALPARMARSALRGFNRWRARTRSGSVYAEMDRIVAEANDDTVGSGLAASLEARSRTERLRRRAMALPDGAGPGTSPPSAQSTGTGNP